MGFLFDMFYNSSPELIEAKNYRPPVMICVSNYDLYTEQPNKVESMSSNQLKEEVDKILASYGIER